MIAWTSLDTAQVGGYPQPFMNDPEVTVPTRTKPPTPPLSLPLPLTPPLSLLLTLSLSLSLSLSLTPPCAGV